MNDLNPLDGLDFHKGSPPKTSSQLDLEVMDRKPVVIPEIGDKVKIKSREWYEKWEKSGNTVPVRYDFTQSMKEHCGKILTIKNKRLSSGRWLFIVEEAQSFNWSLEMFEEVYPQELSTGDGFTKASDAIGTFIGGLGKGLSVASAIPAINPVQGIGISYDLGTLSRQGVGLEAWSDTSPRTNLPQSCFGRISAVVHQDFLKKEEPELQTIKKHRFIKLEKL